MDTNEDLDRQSADALHNEALDDAIASQASSGGHEARRERLEAYETAAADKADPLEALLTYTNAHLLDISFSLGDTVKQLLAAAPHTIEGVRQVEPALNNLLRVHRQVDRFAQLETRITNARAQADIAKKYSHLTEKLDDAQRPPRRPH